ncbi:uncharacterized protein LOC141854118 [Brevipalpus obovatus]|uniref:uncharacterized protein LOC141854118 n=1 Tax=Brevipalpus obovatus TaxID=246614 RepID=UPI003D9E05F2
MEEEDSEFEEDCLAEEISIMLSMNDFPFRYMYAVVGHKGEGIYFIVKLAKIFKSYTVVDNFLMDGNKFEIQCDRPIHLSIRYVDTEIEAGAYLSKCRIKSVRRTSHVESIFWEQIIDRKAYYYGKSALEEKVDMMYHEMRGLMEEIDCLKESRKNRTALQDKQEPERDEFDARIEKKTSLYETKLEKLVERIDKTIEQLPNLEASIKKIIEWQTSFMESWQRTETEVRQLREKVNKLESRDRFWKEKCKKIREIILASFIEDNDGNVDQTNDYIEKPRCETSYTNAKHTDDSWPPVNSSNFMSITSQDERRQGDMTEMSKCKKIDGRRSAKRARMDGDGDDWQEGKESIFDNGSGKCDDVREENAYSPIEAITPSTTPATIFQSKTSASSRRASHGSSDESHGDIEKMNNIHK